MAKWPPFSLSMLGREKTKLLRDKVNHHRRKLLISSIDHIKVKYPPYLGSLLLQAPAKVPLPPLTPFTLGTGEI